MKVSIVTITSNNDGNVEVTTKPFSTFEKAAKYLYKEYVEIKSENNDDEDFHTGIDEVNNLTEDSAEYFYIEDDCGLYWVSGNIYTMEVE
jgi:hypothetical protein